MEYFRKGNKHTEIQQALASKRVSSFLKGWLKILRLNSSNKACHFLTSLDVYTVSQ